MYSPRTSSHSLIETDDFTSDTAEPPINKKQNALYANSNEMLTRSLLFPLVHRRSAVLGLLHFSLGTLGVHHRALHVEVHLGLLHLLRLWRDHKNGVQIEKIGGYVSESTANFMPFEYPSRTSEPPGIASASTWFTLTPLIGCLNARGIMCQRK